MVYSRSISITAWYVLLRQFELIIRLIVLKKENCTGSRDHAMIRRYYETAKDTIGIVVVLK